MKTISVIFKRRCIVPVIVCLLSGLSGAYSQDIYSPRYSERMANSIMARHPGTYGSWDYVTGTVLKAFYELWRLTGDEKYYDYIKNTVDNVISEGGAIEGYNKEEYNIDEINEGRMLLLLYRETGESRYSIAAGTLRQQLMDHPRTSEGGFWHKLRYPNQMWLDGLYMGSPFLAEYGKVFDEPADYDDVINQIGLIERHLRDSATGLFYHGWDESKTEDWADPVTGTSPSFWGRAMGWYAMAIVEVLDYIPADHPNRDSVINIMGRFAQAIESCQDSATGVWWQVSDQGGREGNYLESSESCMFTYALAKAVRMGYIGDEYLEAAEKGYQGILSEFITANPDSSLNLEDICLTAGLGYGRDGSYDYYVYGTSIVSNDGKGTGPFILASLEMEHTLFPPLDLRIDSVSDKMIGLDWVDQSVYEDGFLLYRYREGSEDTVINLAPGIITYADTTVESLTSYSYVIAAYNENDTSAYSNEVSAVTLGTGGAPAFAENPSPGDGQQKVSLSAVLSWEEGQGATSHDIYFGTVNPPPFVENREENNYDPGTLEYSVTYYWKVDEVNEYGTTPGAVWSFSTVYEPLMAGYWKLDESQGIDVFDSSGFGNHGIIINITDTAHTGGKIKAALSFNGTDEYVMIDNDDILNFEENSFTVCFWMKQSPSDIEAPNEYRYVIKGSHEYNAVLNNSGKRYEVFLNTQNSEVRFAIDDNLTKSRVTAGQEHFVTGDWVFVTAVRDAESAALRLYANASLKSVAGETTGNISQDEELYFGYCEDFGSYFKGTLDEIRLYNYALDNSQIDSLFTLGEATRISKVTLTDPGFCIFPDPADRYIKINLPGGLHGNIKIYISDASGTFCKLLSGSSRTQGELLLTECIEDLNPGIYFVRLIAEDTAITEKICIKH
jgi:unsaturated rhamnogalacturonyl hydrolase